MTWRRLCSGLVLLGLLTGSGCSHRHLTLHSYVAPTHSLGGVTTLVLVRGSGSESQLQEVNGALVTQGNHRGHYEVRDESGGAVRLPTSTDAPLEAAEDTAAVATAFVRVDVVEWTSAPAIDPVGLVDAMTGGAPSGVIPRVRGQATLRVTVVDAHGRSLMGTREFRGAADAEVAVPPPPVDRMAVRAAAATFLDSISPTVLTWKVRMDTSDERQRGFVATARGGAVERAAQDLGSFVEKHAEVASGHYNLAVVLDALGEYGAALNHYDSAIRLGGRDWYVQTRAGCARRLEDQSVLRQDAS